MAAALTSLRLFGRSYVLLILFLSKICFLGLFKIDRFIFSAYLTFALLVGAPRDLLFGPDPGGQEEPAEERDGAGRGEGHG